MIFTREATLPGINAEPATPAEVKTCPCGGSLAGKLLTGWETGAYSGRTVLECATCGRREAIVRRMIEPPKPKNRKRRAAEVRVCARPTCDTEFHPHDYGSRQRYCSVDCGNKDRAPSRRSKSQAPTYANLGRDA